MRPLARLLAPLAGALCLAGALAGQDGSEPSAPRQADDAVRALEALDQHASDGLNEDQRANLINKGRIAEETHARLASLAEAGNPHIQKGPSLLLPGFQRSPDTEAVDLAQLREETIARIERRAPSPRAAPSSARPAPRATSAEGAPAPAPAVEEESPPSGRSYGQLLVVVLALGAGIGGAVWVLRSQ